MMLMTSLFLSLAVVKGFRYDDLFHQKVAYPAAVIANCDTQAVAAWNAEPCTTFPDSAMAGHHAYFNVSHGQKSFCAWDPNTNVLMFGFGGSGDVSGWVANVDFHRTDYPNCADCAVERSFLRSYEDSSESMLACYGRLRADNPTAKTVVTGHGLGGAISHFFAVDLKQIFGHTVDYHATFGSPRVGNKAFADYFNRIAPNSARVVHHKDIISQLPQRNMGFTHAGTELWYNADMSSYTTCSDQEELGCSNQVPVFQASLDDHNNYFNVGAYACKKAVDPTFGGRRRLIAGQM